MNKNKNKNKNENKKRMSLEQLVAYIVGVAVLFPIITNILGVLFPEIKKYVIMIISFPLVYHGNSPWLGYIGGYFGAIFGGAISGLITLLGVKLTIKEQRRKDNIDSYPKKRKNGDDINELIYNWNIEIRKAFDNKDFSKLYYKLVSIEKCYDDVISKSAEVNGKVYGATRTYMNLVKEWLKFIKDESTLDSYGQLVPNEEMLEDASKIEKMDEYFGIIYHELKRLTKDFFEQIGINEKNDF